VGEGKEANGLGGKKRMKEWNKRRVTRGASERKKTEKGCDGLQKTMGKIAHWLQKGERKKHVREKGGKFYMGGITNVLHFEGRTRTKETVRKRVPASGMNG